MSQATPMPDPSPLPVLTITRQLAAPRAAVFRALTIPEQLARWFGPAGVDARRIAIDLRVGGRYSLEFHDPDGAVHPLSGTYQEVTEPERLVFTWIWGQGDLAGVETLVTIELRERAGGTELTLTHEKLPSDAARELHDEGWTSTFDCLVRHLEEAQG